jgi:serine/threonine protein kinase
VLLAAGTRLGPYEIVAPLGAGGMGEVYRGRDPRIGREVAIKILPSTFAEDAERLRRFEQEARAAGALNHPNILVIYDTGTEGSNPYIVSELLEGETLREKLEAGALPHRKVADYARQIALGLAAAHDKGIVHRDLKPENLFITRDGRVKILDFGLAKLSTPEVVRKDSSRLQTIAADSTPGMVLGTVGYMSPEQVRGLPADHRSDIFTFGAILYEMLTRKRAFRGDTAADTMSAILQKDPPELNESNPDLPQAAARILRHCLEKNPEERLQSMRDVAIYLETFSGLSGSGVTAALPAQKPKIGVLLPWMIVAALALTASLAVIGYSHRIPKPDASTYLSADAPAGGSFGAINIQMALSPDGNHLVFAAPDSNGKIFLWDRNLHSSRPNQLIGTENAEYPFWSPDSRFVGFFVEGSALKVVDVKEESVRTLCGSPAGRGGSWGTNGTILFARDKYGGIYQVPAEGGSPKLVTDDPFKDGISYRWPQFLPDQKNFIYSSMSGTGNDRGLFTSAQGSPKGTLLLKADSQAIFVKPDCLIFTQSGKLMMQRLDLKTLRMKGEAISIASEPIAMNLTRVFASFSASQNGTLSYQANSVTRSPLIWVDRTGKQIATAGSAEYYSSPRISPDEKRIAAIRHEIPTEEGDVWVYDDLRKSMARFTSQPQQYSLPVWSADGTKIFFGAGDIYWKPADGATAEQRLLGSSFYTLLQSVSSDGKLLLYTMDNQKTLGDIWVLPLSEGAKPYPYLETPADEGHASLSPDAKWIVYDSDESGQSEVYVRPFPSASSGKWQVSVAGGFNPLWRKDGKELYYVSSDNKLMAVAVNASTTFESGTPQALFEMPTQTISIGQAYDVSADGQRILLCAPPGTKYFSNITVVLNWTAPLKR